MRTWIVSTKNDPRPLKFGTKMQADRFLHRRYGLSCLDFLALLKRGSLDVGDKMIYLFSEVEGQT